MDQLQSQLEQLDFSQGKAGTLWSFANWQFFDFSSSLSHEKERGSRRWKIQKLPVSK